MAKPAVRPRSTACPRIFCLRSLMALGESFNKPSESMVKLILFRCEQTVQILPLRSYQIDLLFVDPEYRTWRDHWVTWPQSVSPRRPGYHWDPGMAWTRSPCNRCALSSCSRLLALESNVTMNVSAKIMA